MKDTKGPAAQLLEMMEQEGIVQISLHRDSRTGMKAVLVIDSVAQEGRQFSASGGTRFAHKDPDTALKDAMRLARAMSRKAKVLGVQEGGAKAVVIADREKTVPLLHAAGDFIQMQGGTFRTAIDLGFSMRDATTIASRTSFLDSLSHCQKGLGSTGENTAEGMVKGFETISRHVLGKPLKECTIAIQGLGAVGMALAKRLVRKGCKVTAADTCSKKCEKASSIGVTIVPPEEILTQQADILAPCALGGVIRPEAAATLRCKVIAGGANNILDDETETDKALTGRGIIFVPEFVLNSAGFLQALVERRGGTVREARQLSRIVPERIQEVIKHSRMTGKTLLEAGIELFGTEKDKTQIRPGRKTKANANRAIAI
ncbi:hypothetical protein KY363_07895 [Candidatus Woesearchaeota archaeon]|nr:hypothetical protein [Candidatus Woesearchaeota archaeon]